MLEHIQGIYKIENKVTKKIYIGSSYDISRRWTDHIYLLNKGIHHSVHLQNSWNKYGSSSFTFEILEECSNILEREQYYLNTLLKADEYIKSLNTDFLKLGYNIKPTVENNKGYKHSEETLKKILITRNKLVLAISIEGSILKEFLSTGEASKYYHVRRAIIQNSIKRKSTCKKGFNIGFIYKKDYFAEFKPKKLKVWNEGIISGKPALNAKPVYVYDLSNKLVKKFISLRECALFYNSNSPVVWSRIHKKPIKNRKASPFNNLRLFDKPQFNVVI